jgi:hypothetical protein
MTEEAVPMALRQFGMLAVGCLFLPLSLLLGGCNAFNRSKGDKSEQRSVVQRSEVDGSIVFEGIFIDELTDAGSVFRFCPYYAQVTMQYDEQGHERPVVDQLIAASQTEGKGQFVFLQDKERAQNLPFSSADFDATLSEFDRAATGRTGVGALLRRTARAISLAGDAVDGAATRFTQTLTIAAQSKKSKLELREQLIADRVEITTTALMTKDAIKNIESIAGLEHRPTASETVRLAADAGRDLSEAQPSETFALLLEVYRKTPRSPQLSKSICQSESDMAKRLEQLKMDLGSY